MQANFQLLAGMGLDPSPTFGNFLAETVQRWR